MKLVKLQQPEDYRYQGKTIYLNPEDVTRITAGDEVETSLIKVRSGECFTVKGKPDDLSALFQDVTK